MSDAAPADIMSGETIDAADIVDLGAQTGLPAAALRPDQVALLRSLAAVYARRVTHELAGSILAQVDQDLSGFCFAWAGSSTVSVGQPHYYRLEGRRFLAEFDNRPNSANHIHSVWREPNGDFGARLLREGMRRIS